MGPKSKPKVNTSASNTECEPPGNLRVVSSNLPSTIVTVGDALNTEEAFDFSKYSKRKLTNNWKNYPELENEETEIIKGLNFSDFCKERPTMTDSHFRFSSEKNWEALEKLDDYFKLNVANLAQEIMCVPLHMRLKLKPSMLTIEQINMFNTDAKKNENQTKTSSAITADIEKKILNLLVNESETKNTSGWPQQTEEPSEKQNTWDSHSENFFCLSGVEEELDLILSIPVQSDSLIREGNC